MCVLIALLIIEAHTPLVSCIRPNSASHLPDLSQHEVPHQASSYKPCPNIGRQDPGHGDVHFSHIDLVNPTDETPVPTSVEDFNIYGHITALAETTDVFASDADQKRNA
jgi:hypothetical protein